ncbi:MAG: hypothetical protein DRH57_05930 [Candidatus Cloacimonadota bacterium]|nr:MAG: hypothetical protein DRH57_05930 [Candidatus Cloacimonadota bacterium]
MAFNTNLPHESYVSQSQQTVFTFDFKIYEKNDLIITKGIPSVGEDDWTIVPHTEFDVTINGDDGGTVYFLTPQTFGTNVILERHLTVDRYIEYKKNGDLYAEILNIDQDYQTYLIQDANYRAGDSYRNAIGYGHVSTRMPEPSAGAVLVWNDDETALINNIELGLEIDDAIKAVKYAREWAVNPILELVDDGFNPPDFSSYHYSNISKESAVYAKNWENYSQDWSSNPVDDKVNDGVNPEGYSSYHWSVMSRLSAQGLFLVGTWNPNDGIAPKHPNPSEIKNGDYWVVTEDSIADVYGFQWHTTDKIVYLDTHTPDPYIKLANYVHWDNIFAAPSNTMNEINEVIAIEKIHFDINFSANSLVVRQNGIVLSPANYTEDTFVDGVSPGFTLITTPEVGDNIHAQGIAFMLPPTTTVTEFYRGHAETLTAESYATRFIDGSGSQEEFVIIYESNGDGTYSEFPQVDVFSSKWYDAHVTNITEDQIQDIIDEGTTQVDRVIDEGDTQIALVIAEGTTQTERVEAAGDAGELSAWDSEAEAMTSDSYATEPMDVFVKEFTSNGDGTFTETATTDYSSFHWSEKAKFAATGLVYLGTWDASTGAYPPAGTDTGDFYIISVAGTIDSVYYVPGDWLIWDATQVKYVGIFQSTDWTTIANIPDNVTNAITAVELQVETDRALAAEQANTDNITTNTLDIAKKIDSVTTNDLGSDRIANMVSIAKADYDQLVPVANTLYIIVG